MPQHPRRYLSKDKWILSWIHLHQLKLKKKLNIFFLKTLFGNGKPDAYLSLKGSSPKFTTFIESDLWGFFRREAGRLIFDEYKCLNDTLHWRFGWSNKNKGDACSDLTSSSLASSAGKEKEHVPLSFFQLDGLLWVCVYLQRIPFIVARAHHPWKNLSSNFIWKWILSHTMYFWNGWVRELLKLVKDFIPDSDLVNDHMHCLLSACMKRLSPRIEYFFLALPVASCESGHRAAY